MRFVKKKLHFEKNRDLFVLGHPQSILSFYRARVPVGIVSAQELLLTPLVLEVMTLGTCKTYFFYTYFLDSLAPSRDSPINERSFIMGNHGEIPVGSNVFAYVFESNR